MTFNPGADISGGQVSAAGGGGGFAGRGLAIGGGGGGCLMAIVLIIYMIMGGNPLTLLGASDRPLQEPQSQSTELGTECRTGADANRDDKCLVKGVVASADAVWGQVAPQYGIRFSQPSARLFTGQVQTACGAATSASGPFYCPGDSIIYIDTSFYSELKSRFGSDGGQLAKEYVIAHEYGHHIQNLQGILSRIDHNKTGPQSDSVRSELQADCYAGIWAHYAASAKDRNGTTFLEPLTQKDIQSALSAASAVGDDHIQGEVAGGQVRPDTWTHGSSAQREKWFTTGYQSGDMQRCDTFSVRQV